MSFFCIFKASIQRHNEDTVYHTLKNEIYQKPFCTELKFETKIIYQTSIATGHVLVSN